MTGEPTDDSVLAEAVDWRMRLDEAPDDPALRRSFEAWLAATAARRAAWADVEHLVRLEKSLGEMDIQVLERATVDHTDRDRGAVMLRQRTARGPSRLWRFTAAAAVAVAACLAVVFLPAIQLWIAADHRTGTAELRDILLEDGSTVSLDAGSAIAVHYGPERREVVLLKGRAFFRVVPGTDRPFVVPAGKVTVTVTGTAFDVSTSGAGVSVAVQSGTVQVTVAGGAEAPTVLTRGEKADIDGGSRALALSTIAPEDVASWREGRLIVDRATLAAVVEELDRHFPGIVVLRDAGLAQRRVSGVFDLARPVEALQAIARTHDGTVSAITPYLLVVSPR